MEVKGKKVEISEHGNYILGTLDGIDFVGKLAKQIAVVLATDAEINIEGIVGIGPSRRDEKNSQRAD